MTQPETKRVALTFEAGGDPEICGRMLDVLEANEAVATIFLDGAWSERYPQLVERMASEGHELGNHAYSHPDLTQLNDNQVLQELAKTDELAQRLTGKRAHPFFRPPFAASDQRVNDLADQEGYRVVQRNAVDGGHWVGETTADSVLQRTLDNAYDGAVIAYHLNSPKTLAVLPKIITQLRESGVELVTLSEMSEVSEYPERHPDFEYLDFEPGYLQVMQAGVRTWSMNAIEYDARVNNAAHPDVPLAKTDTASIRLLNSHESGGKPASHDRYLLVMAGEIDFYFQHEDQNVLHAHGRPGDLILWAKDYALQYQSVDVARKGWVALVIE